MIRVNLLLISLFLLMMINGCKREVEESSVSEEEALESFSEIENELSEIYLPISYNVDDLEDLINSKVKKVLYEDNSYDNHGKDNLKLKVTKAGRLRIAARGNTIYYNLPVKIDCSLKKKLLPVFNTHFSLRIKGKSVLDMDENWKLVTKSEYIDIEWIEKPKIKIGFAKINLAKIVEKVLSKKSDELFANLDKTVHEKVNVKNTIDKIWNDIQKPILINKKEKEVWLKFNTHDISVTKIHGTAERISLHTKIHAYIHTVLGDTSDLKNYPLPKLQFTKDHREDFTMHVLGKIPFNDVNAILNTIVPGQVISHEGHSISLQGATLSGKKGKVNLQINFDGEVSGQVSLVGSLGYDSLTQSMQIIDFDYKMESNEIVSLADWFLHDKVKSSLQEKLSVPLAPLVAKLPQLVNKGIEKGKTGRKLDLLLNNVQLAPKKILVTSKDIQLLVGITGNGLIELENL